LKDIKYNIGLTLAILAFIACSISYYLIIFGLPVFLVGAILIFISKKSTATKLLSTILPIVLWLPTTFVFLYFYGKTTPETYLIPKDFNGKFRVIYGEQCGIEPKEENGRRVLEIPDNGILIIKPEFEAGTVDHEYYSVDKNGHRVKLTMLYDFIDSKGKSGVYLSSTGSIGGPMPDGGSSSESPLAIEFGDFYVLNGDKTQKEDNRFETRFDSLTTANVDLCRHKN
jgi:energy-coupling factor transporter transmembrane protein EcfT